MSFETTTILRMLDRIILFFVFVGIFYFPISNAIIESASISAIVFYVLKKILERVWLPDNILAKPLFVYFAVCAVSVIFSVNLSISLHALIGKLLQGVLFFFVVFESINSAKRVRAAAYIILAASLLLGIDGIYQYFFHVDFLRCRKLYNLPRISGPFRVSTDFGTYLAVVIPLAVCLWGYFRDRLRRCLSAGIFFLLFSCLILTVSRGAWFAAFGALLFISIWLRRTLFFVAVLPLIALAIAKVSQNTMMDTRLHNMFGFLDVSGVDRLAIWKAAINMIKGHPWLGAGLGTFMFNFQKAAEGYSHPNIIPYAHNCYLQIMAETGVLGFAAFMFALVLLFHKGIRVLSAAERDINWYVLLASLSSVVAFLIQMSVDTNFYSLSLSLFFWALLGLSAGAARNIERDVGEAA